MKEINIPLGTQLVYSSDMDMRGVKLIGKSGIASQSDSSQSRILLKGNASLVIDSQTIIKGMTIEREGAKTTPDGLVGYIGSAIKPYAGSIVSDVVIKECNIFGFDVGIDGSSEMNKGRFHLENINFDCRTPLKLRNVLDTCYFSNLHQYPFLGNAVVGGNYNARRGSFIELLGNVDWLQLTNCFSHSTENYIKGKGLTGTIVGGGYDFECYGKGIGTGIEINNDDRASGVKIIGVEFNGGHCHIRANQQGNTRLFIVNGCHFKNAGWGYFDIIRGNGNISGCTYEQKTGQLDWIGQIQNDSDVVVGSAIYPKTKLGVWANIGTGKVLESPYLVK